jgi:sterol desaturase/sphingolipid hydroxylase (fatty acid hydroxylase superfamily)/uncharacterized protein (DUF2147 family)
MESIKIYFNNAPDSHRVILMLVSIFIFWNIENIMGLGLQYKKWRHAFFNTSFLFITLPIQALFSFLSVWAYHWVSLHPHFGLFHFLPFMQNVWVECIVTFIVFDFFEYVYHILMHKYRPLWLFHVVHHSDTVVDVSTTFREHPMEAVLRMFVLVINIILCGASMWALLLRQFIQVFFTAFTHAQYRLPNRVNNWMSLLFITPNLHHVHHHATQPYTDSNYGDVFSIWDRMFGTYRNLDANQVVFGIDNYIAPKESKNLLFLMKFPFKKYKGKISTTLIVLFSLFVANATFAQASNPDFLLGNWISPEKDLIINCYKCNNKYFGKVVWFKKYEGKIEDNANGIQESTWLNTVVVKDLTYCNGKWINGTIHDLKSDKTYDAVIKPRTNNSIDIRGYIYFQLFGRTITFYRYEEKQLPYFDTSN